VALSWWANRRSRFRVVVLFFVAVALGLTVHPVSDVRQAAIPSAGASLEMGQQVAHIFSHACADCHSNSTVWPWYSYIAPASWLIEHDVKKGRARLNVSTWEKYSLSEKRELLADIATVVANHEMPLKQYKLIHQTARLSETDTQILISWASKQRRLLRNTAGQLPSP
jgi:Haem-binding domain